jgi:Bacterial SH3 domain
MKRIFAAWLVTLCFVGMASAQTATVKRNVNLRPSPSTADPAVETLTPSAQVQLLESNPTNGFYHVKAADGQQGWVWARNVSIEPAPAEGGTPSSPAVSAAAANEIPSDWEKPDAQGSTFHSQEGDCGPSGKGGDSLTNPRKNRIDIPTSYHPVTWDAINNLTFPQGAPRSLDNWTDAQRAEIAPFEGVAVTVEGFLVKVKVETSSVNAKHGGESTNCHFHLAPDVDWHMPLTAHANEGEAVAIIVETTPRIRAEHPKWTVQNLSPWIGTGQEVRVSGWLLLDPEHQDMIDSGLRSTLWEVHPVTKIEVLKAGQWVDLDNL